MITPGDIANRHLLPASGLANASLLGTRSVRVVVAEEWGSSVAGQLLTSCLVNVLCRQVGIISRIEVVATPTATLISLPGIAVPAAFPSSLEQLAAWAVKDRIPFRIGATDSVVDYMIMIGAKLPQHSVASRQVLVVIGDGWRAWIGEGSRAPRLVSPRSTNPLGPFFAASLASGEIFKRSRGILRGRYLTAAGFSLWTGRSSEEWGELEDGPELAGLSLPATHVVGAGAVGNALAYVIASAQFAHGYVIPIDDDIYDGTNLNRCTLAGWHDQEHDKVESIARMLSATNVGVFPFPGSIKEYVTDEKIGLRPDVAAKVNQLEFDVVVSCVDKRTARQDVQGLWPSLLLGGSTLDLQAKTNVYGLWPGAACLACHNPAERDGDKVRALEVKLRNMPSDQRRRYLEDNGLNAAAIEDYLVGAQCGGLGEAILKSFATRPSAQFSVGFVSLGAGALLGAALFQQTIFRGHALKRADMTSFNYLNGNSFDAGLGYDPSCELGCYSDLPNT